MKERRNIVIVDQTKYTVSISLWGNNAKIDDYSEGDIIAIRGAKVSDYSGKTLNSGSEHSEFIINLEHPKSTELKEWV